MDVRKRLAQLRAHLGPWRLRAREDRPGIRADNGSTQLHPYEAIASKRTADDVFRQINSQIYAAHGPDEDIRGVRGLIVDPLAEYDRLLTRLGELPHLSFAAFGDQNLHEQPRDVRCLIRHDIDVDIVGALQQAELEAQHGVRSTWFVLHTAPYYGQPDRRRFERYESMGVSYRRLQELGHEVAVHTDPLLIYQSWSMDGASGLATELSWLRSLGISVIGTTAHNSVGVYNAANYAIFKGRPRALFEDPADCPAEVEKDGRIAYLHQLDETQLDLRYEANDLFWQSATPVTYAVLSSSDRWWWEAEKSNERIKDLQRTGTYQGSELIDTDELIDRISRFSDPRFVCLVLHPVYYGLRTDLYGDPPVEYESKPVILNEELGWKTWDPGELVALPAESPLGRQTITRADNRGMLARLPIEEADVTIAFMGSSNLDGRSVPIASHVHSRIEDAIEGVDCPKLAHPSMGTAQLFGWFEATARSLNPDVVVLRVGADEISRSLLGTGTGEPMAGQMLVCEAGRCEVQSREIPGHSVGASLAEPDASDLDELGSQLAHWQSELSWRGIELVVLYEHGADGTGLRPEHCKELLADLDVTFVDPTPSLKGVADSVCRDGTWTATGHRVVAQVLEPVVAQIVEQVRSARSK